MNRGWVLGVLAVLWGVNGSAVCAADTFLPLAQSALRKKLCQEFGRFCDSKVTGDERRNVIFWSCSKVVYDKDTCFSQGKQKLTGGGCRFRPRTSSEQCISPRSDSPAWYCGVETENCQIPDPVCSSGYRDLAVDIAGVSRNVCVH